MKNIKKERLQMPDGWKRLKYGYLLSAFKTCAEASELMEEMARELQEFCYLCDWDPEDVPALKKFKKWK